MITLKFRLFLFIPFLLLAQINFAFAQTTIKIVDQEKNPLPNAVVEFISQDPVSKQTEAEKVYIMDQINKQFVPHVLIVPENSLVSFPNSDNIRHHVYSFSPAKTFELKLYSGKPKDPVRFENTGVVVMGCNIHDSMVGYIYVSNNNNIYLSDEKGNIILPTRLLTKKSIKLWHPNNSLGITEHIEITLDKTPLNQDVITLMVDIEEPEARDSFEELHLHEY